MGSDVVVVIMMNEQSGSPEVSLAFAAQPFPYRAKPVPRQNRKIARKTRVTSYQLHLQRSRGPVVSMDHHVAIEYCRVHVLSQSKRGASLNIPQMCIEMRVRCPAVAWEHIFRDLLGALPYLNTVTAYAGSSQLTSDVLRQYERRTWVWSWFVDTRFAQANASRT